MAAQRPYLSIITEHPSERVTCVNPSGMPATPFTNKRLAQFYDAVTALQHFKGFYLQFEATVHASPTLQTDPYLRPIREAANKVVSIGAQESKQAEQLQQDLDNYIRSSEARMWGREISVKAGVEGARERRKCERLAIFREGEMRVKSGVEELKRAIDVQVNVFALLSKLTGLIEAFVKSLRQGK